MVQIFNLESLGKDLFLEIYSSLKDFANLLSSQWYKPTDIKYIRNNDDDIIQIGSGHKYYNWNIFLDFKVGFDIQKQIQKYSGYINYPEMNQTVLVAPDCLNRKSQVDLILKTQKPDLKPMLLDYLSVFDGNKIPNNFELQDLFIVTKGLKLQYNRIQYAENDFKNQLINYHKYILDRNSPILYFLKATSTCEHKRIGEINDVFSHSRNNPLQIGCMLHSNYNEISTFKEY